MRAEDVWKQRPDNMNPEDAKRVLLEVKSVLDVLKIPFFLIFGTCLGAIREKGFIDCDFDIDLGIRHTDLLPKLNVVKAVFDTLGYETHYLSTPYTYNRMIKVEKDGIRVDLVNWDLCQGNYFHPVEPDGKCQVFPRAMFDILTSIEFLGQTFCVPSPPEAFLTELYGPNWRIKDPNYSFRTATCLRLNYWNEVVVKEPVPGQVERIRRCQP